ncbi:2-dehydro-3-deoxyphosphooctonate aldolase [Striga asiatica]|uniref:2-dehydro-3-deoxyphosphooctonate aldolase n=1 Tax=Striga asiatica TaxID=4170 RepID=A0A5A7Q0B8_STRAF|nr:2-dehydro-3-deoxyphosphooctonate aldolase [Striga asiatica]
MAVATSSRLLFISTMSAASIATSVPAPIAMPTSAATSAGESPVITRDHHTRDAHRMQIRYDERGFGLHRVSHSKSPSRSSLDGHKGTRTSQTLVFGNDFSISDFATHPSARVDLEVSHFGELVVVGPVLLKIRKKLTSAAIVMSQKSSIGTSEKSTELTTAGFPDVSVPVLSKTTVLTCMRPKHKFIITSPKQPKNKRNRELTLCAFSRAVPPLISTPREAPFPVATITAVGVANPRAQGQATTNTEIPNCKANSNASIAVGIQALGYNPATPGINHPSHNRKRNNCFAVSEMTFPSASRVKRQAVSGASSDNFANASDVFPFAKTSRCAKDPSQKHPKIKHVYNLVFQPIPIRWEHRKHHRENKYRN